MPIITAPVAQPVRSKDLSNNTDAWTILSWVGVAFVVMGFTDVGLGWYPSSFGNAEWEFGAISAALNGFALPTLGLYFALAAIVASRRAVLSRVLSAIFFMLLLATIALAFIYLTVVPLALKSVAANSLLTAGMQKAIVKASMLFFVYSALFAWGGLRAWRARKL